MPKFTNPYTNVSYSVLYRLPASECPEVFGRPIKTIGVKKTPDLFAPWFD